MVPDSFIFDVLHGHSGTPALKNCDRIECSGEDCDNATLVPKKWHAASYTCVRCLSGN